MKRNGLLLSALVLAVFMMVFSSMHARARNEAEVSAEEKGTEASAEGNGAEELKYLDGKRFGVQTGSTFDATLCAAGPMKHFSH